MEPACKITRYDCNNEEESKKIAGLINAANEQQDRDHGFIDIFPWLGGCDLAEIHYVAQKADGTICGWMTVKVREAKGRKFLYLSEISAIRIQDESYRGVGKRLHDKLVEDSKTEDGKGFAYDFIYLYPLNEKVKATYKDKWGYKDLFPGDAKHEHLYLKLGAQPTPAVKEEIKPKDMPRIYTVQAYRYATEPSRDEALITLISKKRRDLLAKDELVEDLKNVLATVELYEAMEAERQEVPTLDERREMIAEIFKKAPPLPPITAGRRRTRRHKKRRQTRRKRIHRV